MMTKQEYIKKALARHAAKNAVLTANKDRVLAEMGIAADDEDRVAFWGSLLNPKGDLSSKRRRLALRIARGEI